MQLILVPAVETAESFGTVIKKHALDTDSAILQASLERMYARLMRTELPWKPLPDGTAEICECDLGDALDEPLIKGLKLVLAYGEAKGNDEAHYDRGKNRIVSFIGPDNFEAKHAPDNLDNAVFLVFYWYNIQEVIPPVVFKHEMTHYFQFYFGSKSAQLPHEGRVSPVWAIIKRLWRGPAAARMYAYLNKWTEIEAYTLSELDDFYRANAGRRFTYDQFIRLFLDFYVKNHPGFIEKLSKDSQIKTTKLIGQFFVDHRKRLAVPEQLEQMNRIAAKGRLIE